jgi:hypothetical protein
MGNEKNLHEMEIKKPDIQMMLQDFAAAQRLFADERRNFEKRLAEEREMARWREERIRQENDDKAKMLDGQIKALLTIIGDLKRENLHLYDELVAARLGKNNEAEPAVKPAVPGTIPTRKLPVVMSPDNIKLPPFASDPGTGGMPT